MPVPSLPTEFDVAKHVQAGRADCHITVGFDQRQSDISRFLVQLHYQAATFPVRWESIARMDHNPRAAEGHDIYSEGLHVDVSRKSGETAHLHLRHNPLSTDRGMVIRGCVEYLKREAGYFIDVYEERKTPSSPPRWSNDSSSGT